MTQGKIYLTRHAAKGSVAVRGFTLVEILVSLLVFSLGLLGIAGLQAATSAYKMNSWSRSAASLLAADFADMVRANPTAAGAAFWDSPKTSFYQFNNLPYAAQRNLPLLASVTDCRAVKCTPTQRAAFDVLRWRYSISAMLPMGAAWVEGNRTDGFNVTLMWHDKDYVDESDPSKRLLTAQNCSAISDPASPLMGSCCPDRAAVPPGARCQNFFFIP